MTKEQKELVVKLYLTPLNIYQVSKQSGLSAYYVKKILKEFNIPEHPKEIKNKLMVEQNKKSKLEKYGTENYVNIEKRKQTLAEKDEQYWLARNQKVKETCLERYGSTNIFKTDEFKERAKLTKLEKYGNENYNNRDKFIATSNENWLNEMEKYKNNLKNNIKYQFIEENVQNIEYDDIIDVFNKKKIEES